jgi:hypothetical protein
MLGVEPLSPALESQCLSDLSVVCIAHQYGEGPNWRIRLLRIGLAMVGLDPELLRHGITREVYVMPLAARCEDFHCARTDKILLDRPTVDEIATAALQRWVIPHAQRYPDYADFTHADLLAQLSPPDLPAGYTLRFTLSRQFE